MDGIPVVGYSKMLIYRIKLYFDSCIVFYNTTNHKSDMIVPMNETVKGACDRKIPGAFCFDRKEEINMADRIIEHPILGKTEKGKKVTFTFDGKEMEGYEGEPISVALKAAGVMKHRYTKKEHKPRGIFCAIGRCTDCVMVVDGKPNVRICVTPLKEGMKVQTQYGVSAEPF